MQHLPPRFVSGTHTMRCMYNKDNCTLKLYSETQHIDITVDLLAVLHETSSLDMGNRGEYRAPISQGRFRGVSTFVLGEYKAKCKDKSYVVSKTLKEVLDTRNERDNAVRKENFEEHMRRG